MNKIKHILLCFIAVVLISCNSSTNSKPVVISTIGMINSIVEEIAKDNVISISLMGPGVDPHLYKPTANDVKQLVDADIIFYNGLHLESKMIDIFKKMSKTKPTIAITKNISKDALLSPAEYEGFHDPHVWFDISLWMNVSTVIKDNLIKFDPKNKKSYIENHTTYIEKLKKLDKWVRSEINSIPKNRRYLVTAHDAFGYFGKAYDMEVIGLQGINTASEAGTKDIQSVTKMIIEKKVPTIFIESSVPVRTIKAVQAAVQAKGHSVKIGEELLTDALGESETKKATYIGMIEHNINSIVAGLK